MNAEDPVTRYKEILETARDAASRVTEHEHRRTIELIKELREADKAIITSTEAEAQITTEITAWWRKVASTMSGLSWIAAGPRPTPDSTADPAALDHYLAQIEPATKALNAALRKATWPRKPG